MLKCGQAGNKNYRFGLRKDQTEEEIKIIEDGNHEYTGKCSKCGSLLQTNFSCCGACGAKI